MFDSCEEIWAFGWVWFEQRRTSHAEQKHEEQQDQIKSNEAVTGDDVKPSNSLFTEGAWVVKFSPWLADCRRLESV